jgi:hypothetical protein
VCITSGLRWSIYGSLAEHWGSVNALEGALLRHLCRHLGGVRQHEQQVDDLAGVSTQVFLASAGKSMLCSQYRCPTQQARPPAAAGAANTKPAHEVMTSHLQASVPTSRLRGPAGHLEGGVEQHHRHHQRREVPPVGHIVAAALRRQQLRPSGIRLAYFDGPALPAVGRLSSELLTAVMRM